MADLTAAADLSEYREFLDDAAVFPPGLAPLETAVRVHLQRRSSSPWAGAVGPLLLALDQVAQAHALATDAAPAAGVNLRHEPLRVGIIIPPGRLNAALQTTTEIVPELQVAGLEVKTSTTHWRNELEALQRTATEAARYVELTSRQISAGALAALQGGAVKLKFRTGGLEASLFPSTGELAAVIIEAVQRDVPFKLTAGLHRAVRHTDPATGFIHHGFLNIAVATALAQEGKDSADIVAVLEEREGARLAGQYLVAGPGWRGHFESFGTCSMLEPLESLAALNLIPQKLLQETTRTETP